MTIGFLPLDTRPCTYDMPVQLAKIAQVRVILPPKELMGSYKKASDTSLLAQWLLQTAPRCEALVISAEQLLYGGLIQSREAKIDENRISEMLGIIEKIKANNAAVAIYLSSVLMRTSISTLDKLTLEYWKKINLYSQLFYMAKAENSKAAKVQLQELEKEIPTEILNKFLNARNANHAVNLECVRLAQIGAVDKLLILQEDCSLKGIHRFEQQKLSALINQQHLNEKVFMFNGTDEAGAELLLSAAFKEKCETEIIWLGEQHNFVASYEDHPFKENLAEHMRSMSIIEKKNAESVLFILTPKKDQREASQNRQKAKHDYTHAQLMEFSTIIGKYVKQGRRCYLLDLDYANGGNTELLKCLAQQISITDLYGYSAWNTACNSLGTLLSQMLASNSGNSMLNRSFTSERILDDGIYQEIVRQGATKRLKFIGEDIYNIENTARAEEIIKQEYNIVRPLLLEIFGKNIPEFEAKLRWPRLFEIAVFTKQGTGPSF